MVTGPNIHGFLRPLALYISACVPSAASAGLGKILLRERMQALVGAAATDPRMLRMLREDPVGFGAQFNLAPDELQALQSADRLLSPRRPAVPQRAATGRPSVQG